MIVDFIQELWYWLKQQFCWHEYKHAFWLDGQPTHLQQECKKCGRLK